jgi:hypothetical protein
VGRGEVLRNESSCVATEDDKIYRRKGAFEEDDLGYIVLVLGQSYYSMGAYNALNAPR